MKKFGRNLLILIFIFISCSKDEKAISIPDPKEKSIEVYKEALIALEDGDIFFGHFKATSDADINTQGTQSFSFEEGTGKWKELIGEKSELLEDGMEVILNSFNDEVISVDLPDTIIVEILEADAVVKGQTASSSYKPAKIKNGIRILVPPHIETGTKVVIKTEDRSYVERAKE